MLSLRNTSPRWRRLDCCRTMSRFDSLLQALVLDKALYELGYELNNRPDWVRIPLIGLLKLL